MKARDYLIIGVILLVLFGVFLIIGILRSRTIMFDLLKEEARQALSLISLAQENSIFAEAKLEDQIIDKLVGIVHYLEEVGYGQGTLEKIRQNFELSSIVVFNKAGERIIACSGAPVKISKDIYRTLENIFFEHYTFREKKHIRFFYEIGEKIFQIELSAEEIRQFNQEYGINRILNQLVLNPMIKYLVLQDLKGILFATPNIKSISRIEVDSALLSVLEEKKELVRLVRFEKANILEVAQPFIVDDRVVGIFRIGVGLENYYQHVRRTEAELIVIFIILFVAGFLCFFFFIKYQNYLNLDELFSRTLGAIDEGVILVNKKGRIVGVNKVFCTMTNTDEKFLLQKNYDKIISSDPFSIKKVLQDSRMIEEERELFNKRIRYATYPLYDQKRLVSGAISILRDMTKIREFEKEQEEKERLSFLGNMVANFAHEIKNPLNGLAIAAQRLAKEFPSANVEYCHLTNTLIKELDSLNRVLNDFLSLARPQLKERQVFNLSQLIEETLDLIREQEKSKGFILKTRIAPAVQCEGNPGDMKGAVLNILLNAVEAVAGIPDRTGEIEISLAQKKREIIIKISDNGTGMAKEEQEKLFKPYFTTKKGGTGLGLYISQKIIKEHHGKISVKSALQRGTLFTIRLPTTMSHLPAKQDI